jgi:hypothetical protein
MNAQPSCVPLNSWQQLRPIFRRLPVNGYQDNAIADILTQFADEFLIQAKGRLQDMERQVDPLQCDASWIDLLAVMAGFVGEYYDPTWPESIRRQLVANAFTLIWPYLGTQRVLDYLLTLFAIEYQWRFRGSFYLNITPMPGVMGTPIPQYFIVVPYRYARNSYEFQLTEKLRRLYAPAHAQGRVCYPRFLLGLSVCGDIL